MSHPSRFNGMRRLEGLRAPEAGPATDRGAGAEPTTNMPLTLPFEVLLNAAGAWSEEDVVAAIRSDAQALGEMGVASPATRYGEAVDFAAYPRAREAAVEAHARSLMKLEGVPPELAQRLAEAELDALEERAGRATTTTTLPAPDRGAPRRRAAMSGPVAQIPWLPVVALILALGLVATGGWAIVATARAEEANLRAAEAEARAAEERARADEAFDEGRRGKATDLLEREQKLHDEEEALRIAAESEHAAIEQLYEEARANLDQSEELWEETVADVNAVIDLTESDMDDGYIRAAAEFFIPFEEIVNAAARGDETVLERFAETRLEGVIMPSLRLIYNTDIFGDDDVLDQVHELLAQLETQRIEAARESLQSGGA